MEALYKEIHQKKEIVVIDYSMVSQGHLLDLMKHSLEVICSYEKSSALVLEIMTGVRLSKEILDYFPTYYKKIKSHVWRWSSVGFGNLIFTEMVHSKQIDPHAINRQHIEWFETKEEAIEFLIGK
ncbi:hypothetical protein [Ekhidna sp.]|uniref:hypothetical protein n=1 Tax=Ekhidna sp. TaxID=2608089 RepID=UPI003B5BC092